MDFQRKQHIAIASALRAMDADLLLASRCYFGGGTAIVLMHGEYRLSMDVDFLCADVDGYRSIRGAVSNGGMSALFGPQVETIREAKADQYGVRGVISQDGQAIKFEIVREARIALSGTMSPDLGVPLLSTPCQFAEKLLANADRGLDRSVAYRDAIDLGFLIETAGCIPTDAIEMAELAYGDDIAKGILRTLDRLGKAEEITLAADALGMTRANVVMAAHHLQRAATAAWPAMDFPPTLPA